ncbi:NAD(P)/FAD-dependent oxidoreductase [Alloalcanivorax marinus]|uniref:NAD(P)/FAD-dependent oxidoreductase n=1 Tax=Alloalcanivorax marinus TaxID=1177169 RepID=UPI0019312E2F|nr:NAD(P)/FAD-dependent oxidoreductase [Alloalcanivorax marinus]MBL7249727.1 NAD(P)/FAD-dependent oxidoreductase [Alloalcanivorax marinus]
MVHWDVIVAGAGQAGCAAAWDLAAGGARVLLLHGGPERPKPCAGGLTIKALRRYRFPVDAVIRERVDRVAMSRAGGPRVLAGAAVPFCVMTHRRELDALCRERALARGAEWRAVAGVRAVRQGAAGVTLTTSEGEVLRATWLVAADGAHSPVRRLLQGQPAASPAMALEGHLPRAKARHYPPMTLDFQEVPGGYGWLFPKGDHINVGLYVWRRDRARLGRDHLADYARRALGSGALEEVAGYPLGTWLARRSPRCGRVLFVGDAAGSTEPLLGEGIYGALVSGQLAAGALLAGRPGDYPLLMADWGEELRQVERVTRIFYGVPAFGYAALSRWLAPTLLAGYAAGLTLGGTKRAWRSLKGRRHLLGSPGA